MTLALVVCNNNFVYQIDRSFHAKMFSLAIKRSQDLPLPRVERPQKVTVK